MDNQSEVVKKKKTKYNAEFKFARALEVIKGGNVAEVARKYGVNPNVLYLWRDQLLDKGVHVFDNGGAKLETELKSKVARLEQMLGKKEVELSLLKNFSDFYASRNTS